MNLFKSKIVWTLLGICGLFVMALGCSDDASYETNHNNADSETGKPNDSDTGKPNDSETGKPNDSDTGKKNDSDTGKQNDSETGSGTDTPDTSEPPGSETWVDETTGLEWQVTPPEQGFTPKRAMEYCEGLDLDGHQDWRLPNISELRSIIRGCPATETGGACPLTSECLDIEGGSCYTDGGPTGLCLGCPMAEEGACYSPSELHGCSTYWSISPQADSVTYYYVVFANASIDFNYGSEQRKYGARCVRGG